MKAFASNNVFVSGDGDSVPKLGTRVFYSQAPRLVLVRHSIQALVLLLFPSSSSGRHHYYHTGSLRYFRFGDAPDLAASFRVTRLIGPETEHGSVTRETSDMERVKIANVTTLYRYQFRPGQREFEQILGSHVDADFSGDYDPTGKAPIPKSATFRPRIEGVQRKPRSSETQPRGPPTLQAGRKMGLQLPVRLALNLKVSESTWTSDRGQRAKAALQNMENNWPMDLRYHDITELSALDLQPQRLRNRRNSNDASAEDELRDWRVLTLGNPDRRGCKACFSISVSCGLVHGEKYPCLPCAEEGEDCELIAEPPKKQGCIKCSSRRIVCSFKRSTDHRGACHECKVKGFPCIAGPKSGYTRAGPWLDDPALVNVTPKSLDLELPAPSPRLKCGASELMLEDRDDAFKRGASELMLEDRDDARKNHGAKVTGDIDAGRDSKVHPVVNTNTNTNTLKKRGCIRPEYPQRTGSQCRACKRDRRKGCYRQETSPRAICGHCRRHGYDCMMERVQTRSPSMRPPSPAVEFVAARPNIPRHAVYGSKIKFSADNWPPCHWCGHREYGHQLYGLVGPPRWFPLVHELLTGRSAEQPAVRMTGLGSRMCWKCTAARLDIISCRGHSLAQLVNSQDDFSDKDVADWLRPAWIASSSWQWCSVCPRPAQYRCIQRHACLAHDYEVRSGCGLVLCEECARELVVDCDSDLTKMITAKEARIWSPLNLRADANFLRADGRLMAGVGES